MVPMERFKLWLGSGGSLNASCTVSGCDGRYEFPFERGMVDGGEVAQTLDTHDCLNDA